MAKKCCGKFSVSVEIRININELQYYAKHACFVLYSNPHFTVSAIQLVQQCYYNAMCTRTPYSDLIWCTVQENPNPSS